MTNSTHMHLSNRHVTDAKRFGVRDPCRAFLNSIFAKRYISVLLAKRPFKQSETGVSHSKPLRVSHKPLCFKGISSVVLLAYYLCGALHAASLQFTPPQGWRYADSTQLPQSVKLMVVGKGAHYFPPSINLGMEQYSGTLKDYLKRVKEINKAEGNVWKDLGSIQTPAGLGSLSQADRKTEWGEVRMLHLILSKEGVIYILNASALKEEFPRFYQDFFAAFQSLHFSD